MRENGRGECRDGNFSSTCGVTFPTALLAKSIQARVESEGLPCDGAMLRVLSDCDHGQVSESLRQSARASVDMQRTGSASEGIQIATHAVENVRRSRAGEVGQIGGIAGKLE